MSTTTVPTAPASSRRRSPSELTLWVLGVAVLATAPGLLAVAVWALHQPWITVPALVLAAVWHWRPGHTKRALLVGAAIAYQQVTQRRQPKTDTA